LATILLYNEGAPVLSVDVSKPLILIHQHHQIVKTFDARLHSPQSLVLF